MIYPMKMDMIIWAFSAILPLILLAVRRALLSTKLNLRRISGQSTTASCGKTDNRRSLFGARCGKTSVYPLWYSEVIILKTFLKLT